MSLTCNAVGDVLALIKLAIDIATFVVDYRDAPSGCRALLQDLRSMERLLTLALPTINSIQDAALKDGVMERLRTVSQHIQNALNLVAKFRSALDGAPVHPSSKWQETAVKWATKQSERVVWALKRNRDAEACRVAIAQSFEPLLLALLLAWKEDQAAVLSVIQESCDGLSQQLNLDCGGLRRAAAGHDSLREDIILLSASHDRLRVALKLVQDNSQKTLSTIAHDVQATCINTVRICRDLRQLRLDARDRQTTHSLVVTIQNNFGQVHGELSEIKRVQREQAERLSQVMANPLVATWARLLSSPGRMKDIRGSAFESSGALIAYFPLDATATGPVIIAALLLSGRAANPAERMAWAGLAFTLFIIRHLTRFCKSPSVINVIFVKGFCDDKYNVPVAEASSPEKLHRALIRRLVGKIGDCLLRQRMYEIHRRAASAGPTRLPVTWTGQLLHPGDEIELAALVERLTDAETSSGAVTCLSCSQIIPAVGGIQSFEERDGSRWATCPRCSAVVQVSLRSQVTNCPDPMADNNDGIEDDNDEFNASLTTSSTNAINGSENNHPTGRESVTRDEDSAKTKATNNTPAFSLQDTLRLCRRIHFINIETSPAPDFNLDKPHHPQSMTDACLVCMVRSKREDNLFCSTLCGTIVASKPRPNLLRIPANHDMDTRIRNRFSCDWKSISPLPKIEAIFLLTWPQNMHTSFKLYRESIVRRGLVHIGQPEEHMLFAYEWRKCKLCEGDNIDPCDDKHCGLCQAIITGFRSSLNDNRLRMQLGQNFAVPFGAGVYLTPHSSTAYRAAQNLSPNSKYSAVLMARTVVGRVKVVSQLEPRLTQAPMGYSAVHSQINDGHHEYVVYDQDAVRPAYLVMIKA